MRNSKPQITFLLFLFFFLIEASLFCGSKNQVIRGLNYSLSDETLTMDLFLPEDSDESYPCVIIIRGGGFKSQNPGGKRFDVFAEYLTRNGFAAAQIGYRGLPDNTYKTTIADTKTAIRFLRKVSAEYNIDPNRIGAMGTSAGATLAVLLAVAGDELAFKADGGHDKFSSHINAVVAYAGVFDFIERFDNIEQKLLQPHIDKKIASNSQWIGEPFSTNSIEWSAASAINYVSKNDPPILFMHCIDDPVVPYLQSKNMFEKMLEQKISSEIKYFDIGGHSFQGKSSKESMVEMVSFFKKTL